MKPVYLFDIDGTLADLSHRLHHIRKTPSDWPAFFAACDLDAPIPHMIGLANAIMAHDDVLFVTGRSDEVRDRTLAWLRGQFGSFVFDEDIYMRKAGDHRPDHIVKLELLKQIKADGWTPIMAFDDRNQVVDMWRLAGIPCAQVAPGDF